MHRCLRGKSIPCQECLSSLTVQRYDILSLTDINSREDEQGMLSSARSINEIITSEIDTSPEVGASRIVLGGFSQGGAMTLLTGLTSERKLAGLVALSSWLPLRSKLKSVSPTLLLSVCKGLRRRGGRWCRSMRQSCRSSWHMAQLIPWSSSR
jgi:dienelactone hydrolase